MNTTEIATMTSRGQIVIPKNIRQSMMLDSGSKFIVMGDGDTVVLKKFEMPSPNSLKTLLAQSRRVARQSNLKKSEVSRAIKEARRKK